MSFRHLSYILSGAAVLLLAATACTQDELADGTRLPEGEYPLIINATGLSVEATPASTRATVDGDWDGVTSVALSLGDETKEYNVTTTDAEKKTATLSNNLSPFWWTSRNDITVSAWWPYDPTNISQMPAVVVKADQSTANDFAASDYISAENQTVHFDNPTLEFSHRTARITVNLREGAGINDLTGAEVYVTGLSTDGGNPSSISTYASGNDTYEALVAPQTVAAGEPFIRVELGGGTFYFRPKEDVELEANSRYTYTVNVTAKGLELAGCTIGGWADGGGETGNAEDLGYSYDSDTRTYSVYTPDGLTEWAKAAQNDPSLNCTLTDDITLPVVTDGGSNWTPIQGYAGTFDGGGKTITGLTINKSTMNVGLFASIEDKGTVKNLKLDKVNVTANSNVGAIAGQNRGTIENCSVSGSVTGSSDNSCVGGIVGWHYDASSITDCHSSATVEGIAYVGGIAGQNSAIITACYSTGSVTATKNNTTGYSYAGGVVGLNNNAAILNACYATGTVTACYWDNNQSSGIGEDLTNNGETTKVTSGDWTEAMNHMNSVLTGAGTGWQYVTGSGDAPLTLQKQ